MLDDARATSDSQPFVFSFSNIPKSTAGAIVAIEKQLPDLLSAPNRRKKSTNLFYASFYVAHWFIYFCCSSRRSNFFLPDASERL